MKKKTRKGFYSVKFWKNKDTLSDMKISYDSVFHGKELGVNKVRSGPKEKLREGSEERKKKEAIVFHSRKEV